MTPAASSTFARVRAEAGASEGSDVAHLERARRTAAGILCSGLVHEFANLLTVIDGLAQISELGIPWNDGQRMMKPPADRCHGLVEAFRHFFGDCGSGASPMALSVEMQHVEYLLRARLRGRGTLVQSRGGEGVALSASRAPRLRLAYLLPLLGALEVCRVNDRYPERIELSVEDDSPRAPRWIAAVRGAPGLGRLPAFDAPNVPNAEDLLRFGEGLARCGGAVLDLRALAGDGGFEVVLSLADAAGFARARV